jgi:hypothetical protein
MQSHSTMAVVAAALADGDLDLFRNCNSIDRGEWKTLKGLTHYL